MSQYREQESDLYIDNTDVGRKYFPIPQDLFITKVKSKTGNTLDENHATEVIGEYDVAGQVYDEEYCGRTFIHFGTEKVTKGCGLEVSGDNSIINDIKF